MQGKIERIGRGRWCGGRGLPALALASLLAGPALAATAPLPAFDFASHTDARFSQERRAGTDALMAAHTPAELERARLRLGTLYLAHLMLPEARSLLGAVDPANLDAPGQARWAALKAGVRIMGGKPLVKDTPDSPLAPANAGWADYRFWAAMNAIRAKDKSGIRANLPGGFARLDTYPKVYGETCLPLFFSAALDIGDWDLAKKIAERFDGYPSLKDAPVYKYLLGRAALGVNRVDQARVAYGAAAQGQGPYAQKALLALVDLGLAAKSMKPAQAQVLLHGSLAAWQGGEIELGALRRLVDVDRMLGDWPDMMVTLGTIVRDFPESADAKPAKKQAGGLIEAYYQYALDGKEPLGRLLSLHRRLVPLYRFDPAFETASEMLADHLLSLGATAMAADEYRRIHDTLQLGVAQGKWSADPARMARLKLGEAEALAAGGRYAGATEALAAAGTFPADLQDRVSALRARIDEAQGNDIAAANRQVSDPGADDLRVLASAAATAGDWSVARDRYRKLWAEHPKAFGETDAMNLLLAASHVNDRSTAQALNRAFPDLGGSPHWATLASALLKGPAKVSPLSENAATTQLSGAQKVIDGVDGALQDVGNKAKK